MKAFTVPSATGLPRAKSIPRGRRTSPDNHKRLARGLSESAVSNILIYARAVGTTTRPAWGQGRDWFCLLGKDSNGIWKTRWPTRHLVEIREDRNRPTSAFE